MRRPAMAAVVCAIALTTATFSTTTSATAASGHDLERHRACLSPAKFRTIENGDSYKSVKRTAGGKPEYSETKGKQVGRLWSQCGRDGYNTAYAVIFSKKTDLVVRKRVTSECAGPFGREAPAAASARC